MRAVVLLFFVGAVGLAGWLAIRAWHPSTGRYAVQGVDVSSATGPLDWNALAANGADFGYALATIGARNRDAAFEGHWRAMADAGMRRGAIHRFSLCEDAQAQADAFNTMVPRDPKALPAAVELAFREECTIRPERPVVISALNAFLARAETHTGKPMLLLVAADFDDRYEVSGAIARGIWAEGNFLRPRYPARPWRMWRASDMRHIEGAQGPVNWDVVTS